MEIQVSELINIIEKMKRKIADDLISTLREDNIKPEDHRNILIYSGKIRGLDEFSHHLKIFIDQEKEKKHG